MIDTNKLETILLNKCIEHFEAMLTGHYECVEEEQKKYPDIDFGIPPETMTINMSYAERRTERFYRHTHAQR